MSKKIEFNKIPQIKIGDQGPVGRAFGGLIYSSNLDVGVNGDPTKLSLNIVPDDDYKTSEFAIKSKIDIGLPLVLQNYQSRFRRVATPLYLTTNGIVNLYTNNTFPAKLVRPFLLRFMNIVKPVKRTFLHVLK